ncbi:MAG: response regulator [Geobacter sp.]|nr:response regulator [Geobacter sp.]
MVTRPKKILCVDDDVLNIRLLEGILAGEGYGIMSARDGETALRILEEGDIDLVLLDVVMPSMDGFEVCRRIKNDERLRHIPVVMLTALTARTDRIMGIRAGAEDFIHKPFYEEEVLARVRMLLKMKELNDRLTGAYDTITHILAYGKKTMEEFNPLHFNFSATLEAMIGSLLNRSCGSRSAPRAIFIGTHQSKNRWSCRLYRERTAPPDAWVQSFPAGAIDSVAPSDTLPVYYGNSLSDASSEISATLEAIGEKMGEIRNFVLSRGDDLCVCALNYDNMVSSFEASVLNSLAVQVLFLNNLSRQTRETGEAFAYTIHALARAAELHDQNTGNHTIRVGEYCAALARGLGIPEHQAEALRQHAQLHDVGKIYVPAHILRKQGELSRDEHSYIEQHPVLGAQIIGGHPRFAMAKSIALHHHEHWDGSGYPFRIKGEAIPLDARITAIADVYDALRNQRSYKSAFDHDTACRIIMEGNERTSPEHFDPVLLQVFNKISPQFAEIYEKLHN